MAVLVLKLADVPCPVCHGIKEGEYTAIGTPEISHSGRLCWCAQWDRAAGLYGSVIYGFLFTTAVYTSGDIPVLVFSCLKIY